ncbi:MAG: hypothetical protein KJ592_01935 [Nanoarchaeota archaeon]|nr:hypothetical protein [Nanoarchaeota archaeon]
MKTKKIILKHKGKKLPLVVGKCNILEQILGLMVFRKRALLLFDFKKPRRLKIHSFFCDPFFAVYTDEQNNILEIIKVISWKPIILPVAKFNKLIEIPSIPRYTNTIKHF